MSEAQVDTSLLEWSHTHTSLLEWSRLVAYRTTGVGDATQDVCGRGMSQGVRE